MKLNFKNLFTRYKSFTDGNIMYSVRYGFYKKHKSLSQKELIDLATDKNELLIFDEEI